MSWESFSKTWTRGKNSIDTNAFQIASSLASRASLHQPWIYQLLAVWTWKCLNFASQIPALICWTRKSFSSSVIRLDWNNFTMKFWISIVFVSAVHRETQKMGAKPFFEIIKNDRQQTNKVRCNLRFKSGSLSMAFQDHDWPVLHLSAVSPFVRAPCAC